MGMVGGYDKGLVSKILTFGQKYFPSIKKQVSTPFRQTSGHDKWVRCEGYGGPNLGEKNVSTFIVQINMFRIIYIQILCCVMKSNSQLPLEMRSFSMYHVWILKKGKSIMKYWYQYMRDGLNFSEISSAISYESVDQTVLYQIRSICFTNK